MEKNLNSNERWQNIFMNLVLDGVLIVRADNHQIVAANPPALMLLDTQIESALGQDFRKYIYAEQAEGSYTSFPENQFDYIECSLVTEKGQKIPVIKKTIQTSLDNTDYIIEMFISIANIKTSCLTGNEQKKVLEALRDTTSVLNQSLNLHDVLNLILNNVGKVVPNDSANIMLIEDGFARMVACRGYETLGGAERVMQQVRDLSEVPNLRLMAETGQPIVVPDTKLSPNWISFNTSTWIRSYASSPICHKGKTIGFLNLNSATPGLFQPIHAEGLLSFANQAAIAIENARLFESAQNEITERKLAEAALQEAKNELEVRVEQRTIQLRQINGQLTEELDRRQQAEATLEKERAQLALRVEERTAELSAANVELAKVAQMKDAFLASMSHELRTPLNAILNISETLDEKIYGDLNETQIKSVRTIEESGRHLLSLINDILDLSKIGAGKFELVLDHVPVETVCQGSLKLIEEAARKKNIIISTVFDPMVQTIWADHRRLKQILVNLLSNAVKFTPNGGSIGLVVTGIPEKKQAKFIVWDTGIGIKEEGIKNLFQPFVQLDSRLGRQYEGTGLGLALVYNLVKLHGGGIQVKSEEGKGSHFTVTLNWSGEMTEPTRHSSDSGKGNNEPLDPLIRIGHFLNEFGIESRVFWIEKKLDIPNNDFPFDADLFVADMNLFQAREDVQNLVKNATSILKRPVILIARDNPEACLIPILHPVGILKYSFDRRELLSVIKKISPTGTARLIHQALILQEKVPALAGNQPIILIADDNETTLRIISDYLLAKRYHIVSAHNGAEAVERARTILPNLILMDIQMPGMDGFEAIRHLRSNGPTQKIPIIALTALAMTGDRALCLEAGANDYISKPVSLSDMVETIELLIQR